MTLMSPGAQQAQATIAGGGMGGSAQEFFDRTFSDMSYEAIQQKIPDLQPHIVTFRILKSDMDSGHAVGAFLISREGHIGYVPSVLNDNKIQPLEIMYSKDTGKFMPLTEKWLKEMMKIEDGAMGDPSSMPSNVNPEVSLRHLFTPVNTGRYGYASADEVAATEEFNKRPPAAILLDMLEDSENKSASYFSKKIDSMLKSMTKGASVAFMEAVVGSSTKVAEWYLNKFGGPEGLARFFCKGQKKIARPVLKGPEFEILPKTSSMKEFKRVFGSQAKEAYWEALEKGFAIKEAKPRLTKTIVRVPDSWASDLPTNVDEDRNGMVVEMGTTHPTQSELNIEWPMDNGFYRVYLSNGKTHDVFVLTDRDNYAPIRGLQTEGARHIIIYADGSYASIYDCCGTPLNKGQAETSNVYKYLSKTLSSNGVRRGYGLFLRMGRDSSKFDFCGPFEIDKASNLNGNIRASTVDGYEIILQKNRNRGGKIHFKDSKICRLTDEYRFVPLTRERTVRYFKQPGDVYQAFADGLVKVQEARFEIKFESAGDLFYVDNRPSNKVGALNILMGEFGASAEDAEAVLNEAKEANEKRVGFSVLNTYGVYKLGQLFGQQEKTAQPQPPMPPEQVQPPMDPAMLEAMMADSAALQQILMQDPQLAQHIAQMVQQLMQQDPAAAQSLLASPTIQQMLSMAGGQQQQQGGAPPMDPAMAQQQAMMGGGMPMDPAMAQQQAMMGGGMPMDPAMAQQQAMMGGGMPMDPSMAAGGMPPEQTGMTTGEEMDMEALNPMFQGDPSMLDQPDLLNMAHLEVLIKSPTLKDVVVEYEDTLIKALDHLGRILFAVQVKAPELKQELGNLQYKSVSDTVRNLFKSMGDGILELHQNTAILSRSLSSNLNSSMSEATQTPQQAT